jgi:hypothetical protein
VTLGIEYRPVKPRPDTTKWCNSRKQERFGCTVCQRTLRPLLIGHARGISPASAEHRPRTRTTPRSNTGWMNPQAVYVYACQKTLRCVDLICSSTQLECILNCRSRGSVVENTPYPRCVRQTLKLKRETVQKISTVARVITPGRSVKPKISQP